MKILIVAREYGKSIVGGAGVATTKLVKYMRLEGADVYVLSFGDPAYSTSEDYIIEPKSSILVESKQKTQVHNDIKILFDIMRLTKEAKNLARVHKYDVLHIQEPYVGGLITYNGRKITTIHDTSYGEIKALVEGGLATQQNFKKLGFYSSLGYLMEFLSIATSDVVITPSHVVKKELTTVYRASCEKVYVIPNGVEISNANHTKNEARDLLNLPIDKLIIFTTAQHIPRKRFDVLLESICRTYRKNRNIYNKLLVIIGGEGFLTQQLKDLAGSRELNNVLFPGWIPSEELPLYFLAADIYVFTSNMESAPLALLEAAAYGLPIVTSRVGDYAMLMENYRDAIVIPPNNVRELEEALVTLIQDSELRKRISGNARKFASHFSWREIARRHLKLYETVIAKRAH